jgi:hypothetical protein
VLVTNVAPGEGQLFEVEKLDEMGDFIKARDDCWAVEEIKIDLQRHPGLPRSVRADCIDRGFTLVPNHMVTSEQLEAID